MSHLFVARVNPDKAKLFNPHSHKRRVSLWSRFISDPQHFWIAAFVVVFFGGLLVAGHFDYENYRIAVEAGYYAK